MNLIIAFSKINRGMPMMKNLHFILFFTMLCFAGNLSAQDSYNSLVYDGNQDFKAEKYDKASTKFMEAIKTNPKDFSAHYNLGNSLYKSKKYEEAEAEYQKANALAKTNADKMATLYNQGNIAMQKNNPEKAAELYKKALKMDPYNEDVRKNFEISMLKKQEKQKKQNKEQNQSPKDKENKDGKGEEKGDSPQKNNGGKDQNQQGEGKGNEDKQNGQNSGLPKELRDAIMDKVGEKEKNTTRRILNKNAFSMPESNEKDW